MQFDKDYFLFFAKFMLNFIVQIPKSTIVESLTQIQNLPTKIYSLKNFPARNAQDIRTTVSPMTKIICQLKAFGD